MRASISVLTVEQLHTKTAHADQQRRRVGRAGVKNDATASSLNRQCRGSIAQGDVTSSESWLSGCDRAGRIARHRRARARARVESAMDRLRRREGGDGSLHPPIRPLEYRYSTGIGGAEINLKKRPRRRVFREFVLLHISATLVADGTPVDGACSTTRPPAGKSAHYCSLRCAGPRRRGSRRHGRRRRNAAWRPSSWPPSAC